MTYEEYVGAGGECLIYFGATLPAPPEGYEWVLFHFGGNPVCYKLLEKPKISGCNCSRRDK